MPAAASRSASSSGVPALAEYRPQKMRRSNAVSPAAERVRCLDLGQDLGVAPHLVQERLPALGTTLALRLVHFGERRAPLWQHSQPVCGDLLGA